jgi:exodeoxyribonuclease V alpha subunit
MPEITSGNASLQGEIERITYRDEKTGYSVIRLRITGAAKPVTVVGILPAASVGEALSLLGEWVVHPRFGKQFQARSCRPSVPVTAAGIERYLGSGAIKGVGPVTARRIVQEFGEKALDILDREPERIGRVSGIGKARLNVIKTGWKARTVAREALLFLYSVGVGAGLAEKIQRRYGDSTVERIRENPYRLAEEVWGIGFLTADRIAAQMGFSPDCSFRVDAGILHALRTLSEAGHLYSPLPELLSRASGLLGAEPENLSEAIARGVARGELVVEEKGGEEAVYLMSSFRSETHVAHCLKGLLSSASPREGLGDTFGEFVRRYPVRLSEKQVEALRLSMDGRVLIVTGGPGTGKTTLVKAILKLHEGHKKRIFLAAPTGRASKRLMETTGQNARTVHRLLEYKVQDGTFARCAENPLACDLLVVDEVSMLDTQMAAHLLDAVPPGASLILVGDADQLPSVGPGNVLRECIASGVIPVVELNEIFRQSRESLIIVNAHRVREGLMPFLSGEGEARKGFHFISEENPENVALKVCELVSRILPQRFGLDPLEDIQVLCPMHKGESGAIALNDRLQEALNGHSAGFHRGGKTFRIGDRVMQVKNDYEKDVFNGDIGRIVGIEEEEQVLAISFDGKVVPYAFIDLDQVIPAYAITVHKSQGSEYPAVVIPLTTQHYLMLQRNLLYTALTRARRLAVVVGTKKALAIAVKNEKVQLRCSRLALRLSQP